MMAAVVPAQNEAGRIRRVLKNVLNAEIDSVFVVINGSTDTTLEEVSKMNDPRVIPIVFKESLGFDVPRAIGALAAFDAGAELIVFADGDLLGNITRNVKELVEGILKEKLDLALTNCYPTPPKYNPLTSLMLHFRLELNRVLEIDKTVGSATPSHGLHAVSRRFLRVVPAKELGIPPVAMALSVKSNLNVGVASTMPHFKLGSRLRDNAHAIRISETIIGDCIEAICAFKGIERSRVYGNHEFLGYHPERRWDLFLEYEKNRAAK